MKMLNDYLQVDVDYEIELDFQLILHSDDDNR